MPTSEQRLKHAFDIAEKHLNIDKFLDPEGKKTQIFQLAR